MTGIEAIKQNFRRQKIKGVLIHRQLEDFYGSRSVLVSRRRGYEQLPNGQIVRRRPK